MARCHHCRSGLATRGYCPDCLTLDPFPRYRWVIYITVTLTVALATYTAVLAAR